MFKTLTDTSKAAIFTGLVLLMAVAAALAINTLGLATNEFAWGAVWSITPTLATVIMLLVVTREGYARKGWQSLGLGRLRLRMWPVAFFGTLAITVAATAAVWATPLASVTAPDGGIITSAVGLVIQVLILATSFALAEEIGIRGYLLPKLLPLGRKRALLLTGLVWATWHLPLLYLTSLIPVGNRVLGLPLFYAAVVAGSFFYGYLRIASGSLWPASIAHAVHNSAWGLMVAFTATSSPVLVNSYLLGDSGIVITVAAIGGAVLVSWLMLRGDDKVRPEATPPVLEPVTPATAIASSRQG
jgi:membrane protease YdiL (CAAX protease family)